MVYVLDFAISLLLVGLMLPLARVTGHVDHPHGRKQHADATPLVGGLAMGVTCLLFLQVLGLLPSPIINAYTGASVLLLFVGAVDDRVRMPPWVRFSVQTAAALIMVRYGGVRIDSVGNLLGQGNIALGPFTLPFTVFAIVGMTNAFNMIDGLDGLAGSVAAGILGAMLLAGVWSGYTALMPATLVLLASVLGFLVWNLRLPGRRHARAFMGDAGSTWVGFSLACLAIALTESSPGTLRPMVAAWLFAVPAFDTLSLIIHRVGRGRSAFAADREHLHHRLQDAGCSVNETVIIITTLTVVLGVLGVLMDQSGVPGYLSAAVALGLFLAYHVAVRRPHRDAVRESE